LAKENGSNSTERCPTGVPGFDEVTGGGFVRGSVVLLVGNPGTGKSIFAARFIHDGALKWREPGVYVSFVEPRKRFYMYMKQFDMDLEKLEAEGLISFIQVPTVVSKEAVSSILDNIFKTLSELNAKRLVIDSITPIIMSLGPLETRATLHNAIYMLSNLFNVTTILITDLPLGSSKIGFGVEEFIADTVILLRLDYSRQGVYRRYMYILKMRGASLVEVPLEYSIMPRLGLVIHTSPSLNLGKVNISRSTRMKTYIEGLDNLLGGGLVRGSSTLIIGPSGSGKTLLMLTIAAENVKHGNKVLYVSFDEPPLQLAETLSLLGYNYKQLEANGLQISYVNPYMMSPGKLGHLMKELGGFKKDLVLMDGLLALYHVLGEEEFMHTFKELALLSKSTGTTLIISITRDYFREGGLLETIADNILVLRISSDNKRIRREILILKSRMNIADSCWHELKLEKDKLSII